MQFKQADLAERAALLDLWSRRRGQMINEVDVRSEGAIRAG